MKNLLTFLMIFSISLNSWGNDVVFLQEGQMAPYSGVLFPESKANELRGSLLELKIKSIENETIREQRDFYHKVTRIKAEEVESFRVQNQRLVKQNENNDTSKLIYFGLGILVSGLAVYGARGLSK